MRTDHDKILDVSTNLSDDRDRAPCRVSSPWTRKHVFKEFLVSGDLQGLLEKQLNVSFTPLALFHIS